MTQLTVDGRQLSGTDRYGDWEVGNVEGLFDTPDRKQDSDPRSLADGDYDTLEFYEHRDITIEGRLIAANHDMMHEGINWLKSMLLNRSGAMFIRGHGPDQWASVKLAGAVRCHAETDTHMKWQLRLKAIDPYLYGSKTSFSGATGTAFDVHQRGTVPAWPFITVTGSMPGGYEIQVAGQLIEVTRALTTGSPHTVDTRSGILRVNGSVVTNGLGIAELFRVNPGLPQSVYSLARTSGTGTVKFDVTDTYI